MKGYDVMICKSRITINNAFSPSGEFWLGLDHIHSLSNQRLYTLQVQLSDRAGEEQLVNYHFRLDGPENDYALHLAPTNLTGIPAGAMVTGASGFPFSTSDRDNDLSVDINCAKSLSGTYRQIALTRTGLIVFQTLLEKLGPRHLCDDYLGLGIVKWARSLTPS